VARPYLNGMGVKDGPHLTEGDFRQTGKVEETQER